VELPIVVKNVTITLSPRSKSLSAKGVGLEGVFPPYAVALIIATAVAGVVMSRKIQRKNWGRP
jgi:hypothetical protein